MEELYLRDYLRVLWNRKWLIAFITFILVVLAAVYVMSQPDQYKAEAQVLWEGPPKGATLFPNWSSIGNLSVRSIEELTTFESTDVLQRFRTYRDDTSQLTADLVSNSINVELVGTDDAVALSTKLEEFLSRTIDSIAQDLSADLDVARQTLTRGLQFFTDKREQILRDIRAAAELDESALVSQRAALIEQIDALAPSSIDASSSQFISLVSQLEATDQALADVRRELNSNQFRISMGIDLQLADIERTISAYELTILDYEALGRDAWQPLTITMEPRAVSGVVGTSKALTIVVAAILGIFLGILLAFFMHFVQTPAKPE